MKKVFLFFSLVLGLTLASCSPKCDCTNCDTEMCCAKCETESVESAQDSTSTVTDTIPVKEEL